MYLRLACASALVLSVFFITGGHYDAGIPLLVMSAIMIAAAERTIHLTRSITRTRDGKHVHLCRNWAYHRHPGVILWAIAAGLVMLSPWAIDDAEASLTVLLVYFATTFVVTPGLHRKAWKESGSRWTEERWDDGEGHPVRQLSIDGASDDPEYAPRIAIRADAGGIDLFVISLCSLKRWERDRFSVAQTCTIPVRADTHRTREATAHATDRGQQTWRQGDRPAIAHAPDADTLAEEFAASGKLTITRLPPFAQPAVFDCTHPGERRRLERFLESARTRHGPR